MAGPPYIKFYPAHWDADTSLLDDAEELAYFRICKEMWKSGRPLREKVIHKAIHYTPERWAEVRPAVEEYFRIEDGVWHHDRVEADMEEVFDLVAKKSKAGKASVLARQAKKRLEAKQKKTTKNPSETDSYNDHSTGVQTDDGTGVGTIRQDNKIQDQTISEKTRPAAPPKLMKLPAMWLPNKETVFKLRDDYGINPELVWPLVPEFRIYWSDRGDMRTSDGWQIVFANWAKKNVGVTHG